MNIFPPVKSDARFGLVDRMGWTSEMTIGLLVVHTCLALTVFLVILAGHLEGAKRADGFLGFLWVALLGGTFFAFGWRAGVLGVLLSFAYGWLSRPVAWYLARRLLGDSTGPELRRTCGRLFLSGLWMLAAVGAGWMLGSGPAPGRIVAGIEWLLVVPLWAEALHQVWRGGATASGFLRAIAWSGIGALLATEGIVTLSRQIHALLDQVEGLPGTPLLLIYALAFIVLYLALSAFAAVLGFRILSWVRRGST